MLIINKTHHWNSLHPRFQALMIFQISILILLNFFNFDVNTPEAESTHQRTLSYPLPAKKKTPSNVLNF